MSESESSPVSRQIRVTFGALCLLLLVIGGLLFFGLRGIERSSTVDQFRTFKKHAWMDDRVHDVEQIQEEVLLQVIASDPAEIKSLEQAAQDLITTNIAQLAGFKSSVDGEKEQSQYDEVMRAQKVYLDETQKILTLGGANQDAAAMRAINAAQAPAYHAFLKSISDFADFLEAEANEAAANTGAIIARIRITADVLLGLVMAILVATGVSIAKVARQLKEDNTHLAAEIKERKRAEESAREKSALLEAQVNCSIDGILIVDENGQQILQNRRFVELFKMPPDVAEEKSDERRLKWVVDMTKNPEKFMARVRRLYAHRDEVSREEIELKDGTILERYTAPVVSGDGTHYGRIWTFRDITARKRIEAQMVQSQRLETVGKLAGGVAHEFNSILTAIIGQSELALGDVEPNGPPAKSLLEIRGAAERAAALTHQLLAYGRKQILQPEVIDLNAVLASMEKTLGHLVGRDVDVRIVPGLGLKQVKIDPGQIEQVIVNITMNAAAVMPNGGKLTLETANATLDADYASRFPDVKAGEYVMLAISDTGTGISPDVKKHLFEPFFTTKPVGQGTGLGLATCYGILKQSGGHIAAYSELSRGATFKMYLPSVEALKPRHLEMSDLPRGTETILVVEDDPALREMSKSLLTRLGYNVLTATNGLEALDVKQQRDGGYIDLVFTDVVMPHMSGKELADRFRVLYPRTRILFTSAYTENAIAHQGALDPGVTLLQKPFNPTALARKVREMLDTKTA